MLSCNDISGDKRGLGRSSERAKMRKTRGYGTTFTKLGACASDHKEGVRVFLDI